MTAEPRSRVDCGYERAPRSRVGPRTDAAAAMPRPSAGGRRISGLVSGGSSARLTCASATRMGCRPGPDRVAHLGGPVTKDFDLLMAVQSNHRRSSSSPRSAGRQVRGRLALDRGGRHTDRTRTRRQSRRSSVPAARRRWKLRGAGLRLGCERRTRTPCSRSASGGGAMDELILEAAEEFAAAHTTRLTARWPRPRTGLARTRRGRE